jgi:TPR repeat protein
VNPNANNTSDTAPVAKAVEICKYFVLSEEGKKALSPDLMPEQFAEMLFRMKRHSDAVQLIAHYLPKRQAVFWAMTCARQATPEPTPESEAALKAAEQWIAEPTEETRKAALKAADAADAGTPAGCVALAAFYSDGLPRTEDPKANARAWFLTAKLVGSAVLLAATADPEQLMPRFEVFITKGLEILKRSRR